VGVYQQITLVQFIDGPFLVSDILVFTVSFKFIKFTSQKFLPLFLKSVLRSFLTLLISINMAWVLLPHSNTGCFCCCTNLHILYQTNDLCLYLPRLSLAEILIIPQIFSQALFVSILSSKFSSCRSLLQLLPCSSSSV